MARKRRRFTAEFKARVALEALRERDSVQAIAARHELHPNQVTTWKRQLLEGLPEVFAGGAGRKAALEHEAKIRDLHAKIGELTVERDFCGAGSSAEPGGTPRALETIGIHLKIALGLSNEVGPPQGAAGRTDTCRPRSCRSRRRRR